MFGFEIYKPEGADNYWICSNENVHRYERGIEYWLIGRVQ